jgi:hypothetical protein
MQQIVQSALAATARAHWQKQKRPAFSRVDRTQRPTQLNIPTRFASAGEFVVIRRCLLNLARWWRGFIYEGNC